MKNFLLKPAIFLAITLCSTCNVTFASTSDSELTPRDDQPSMGGTQVSAIPTDQPAIDGDLPTKLKGLKLAKKDSDDDDLSSQSSGESNATDIDEGEQSVTPRTKQARDYTDVIIGGLGGILSNDCPEQDELDRVFRTLIVQYGERECPGIEGKITDLIAELRAAAGEEDRLAIIKRRFSSHPQPVASDTDADVAPASATAALEFDDSSDSDEGETNATAPAAQTAAQSHSFDDVD